MERIPHIMNTPVPNMEKALFFHVEGGKILMARV